MKKTKYQIARYEEVNQDGTRVWQAYLNGPLFRNGQEVKCQWKPDSRGYALVDQWGYAHNFSR